MGSCKRSMYRDWGSFSFLRSYLLLWCVYMYTLSYFGFVLDFGALCFVCVVLLLITYNPSFSLLDYKLDTN